MTGAYKAAKGAAGRFLASTELCLVTSKLAQHGHPYLQGTKPIRDRLLIIDRWKGTALPLSSIQRSTILWII
jgi:hypothetical protein